METRNAGFKNFDRDAVLLEDRFVYEIQRQGGTVLGSSRGTIPATEIADALVENGITMLFVVGGTPGGHRTAWCLQDAVYSVGRGLFLNMLSKLYFGDIPTRRSVTAQAATAR